MILVELVFLYPIGAKDLPSFPAEKYGHPLPYTNALRWAGHPAGLRNRRAVLPEVVRLFRIAHIFAFAFLRFAVFIFYSASDISFSEIISAPGM